MTFPLPSLRRDSILEEAHQQVRLLERMFADAEGDDVGLVRLRARSAHHPAVVRYDATRYMANSPHMVRYPLDGDLLAPVATMLLDRTAWPEAQADGDFWGFVGDETVQRFFRTRVRTPNAFDDLLAELFLWSWLRSEGTHADLVEEEGLPDVVINRGSPEEYWCEVKRIHVGTATSRLRKVIEAANRQIKRSKHEETAGVVFVSVARGGGRAALDDRVPSDVQGFIEAARDALRVDRYRSVARVVLNWEEHVIYGTPPGTMLHVFQRRSIVVPHPAPRRALRSTTAALRAECAVVVPVHFSSLPRDESVPQSEQPMSALPPSSPAPSGKATFAGFFRSFNEFGDGVRTQHARDAFADPDATRTLQLGDIGLRFDTRRVTYSIAAHTLLIVSSFTPARGLCIDQAYKLYDRRPGDATLVDDPLRAFYEVLARYGIPIRIANRSGLLFARVTVPIPNGRGDMPLVELAEPRPKGVVVQSFFRRVKGGPGEADVAEIFWAHAVDRDAYMRDAREYR